MSIPTGLALHGGACIVIGPLPDGHRSQPPKAHVTMNTADRLWRHALAWQLALGAYMQAISWVPLGRWNYQPCCPTGWAQWERGTLQGVEALTLLAFLVPVVAFVLAGRYRWRWVACLTLAGYGVWLALQLGTWWPPYLLGASERWSRVYARAFAEATQVLPRWGNHLPPDAMHLVLQLLLVMVLITGIRAVRRRFFGRAPNAAAGVPAAAA